MMRHFSILFVTLLLTSCATNRSHEKVASDGLMTLSGVFVSGEYAYFETSNGEVYSLSIKNEEDQRRLAKLAPLRIDGSSTCVRMKLCGRVEKSNGYLNRKLLSVVRIMETNQTPCKN